MVPLSSARTWHPRVTASSPKSKSAVVVVIVVGSDWLRLYAQVHMLIPKSRKKQNDIQEFAVFFAELH